MERREVRWVLKEAVKKSDPALARTVSEYAYSQDRDAALSQIAIDTGDSKLAETIQNLHHRDWALYQLAVEQKSILLLNKVRSNYYKAWGYAQIKASVLTASVAQPSMN